MKKKITEAAGLMCYLIIVGLLFDYNWMLLIKPKPFLSILMGMVILTASQYKKEYSREDIFLGLKWNLLFASFLTTLVSVFSSLSSMDPTAMKGWRLAESLLPMLYGSIIYLLLEIVFKDSSVREKSEKTGMSSEDMHGDTSAFIAEQVFRELGLTDRECHVALKLLGNMSNKEIAVQLYISEATVKKHIQNIYQKSGATDRTSFREIYYKVSI